jgi:hypothetical protein
MDYLRVWSVRRMMTGGKRSTARKKNNSEVDLICLPGFVFPTESEELQSQFSS